MERLVDPFQAVDRSVDSFLDEPLQAMESIDEHGSACEAVGQTRLADKQGVDNKDRHIHWLGTALQATDQELASAKSYVKVSLRYWSGLGCCLGHLVTICTLRWT